MTLPEQLDHIRDRLIAAQTDANRLQIVHTQSVAETQKERESHVTKVALVANDTQAAEVIKRLFDQVSSKGFTFLEGLGTQALQMVFTDENYTFHIKIGSRGTERTVEFLIHDGYNQVPLSETGGGVQVLIAFVLRVYFILRNELRKAIFMDETFAQLSPQYLDNLLNFLQLLVDKFGFVFLWISHSPHLEGRVTKFFEMEKGKLYAR